MRSRLMLIIASNSARARLIQWMPCFVVQKVGRMWSRYGRCNRPGRSHLHLKLGCNCRVLEGIAAIRSVWCSIWAARYDATTARITLWTGWPLVAATRC
uniref:Putative secreted peptide n=1 Tax=Anopheles braziliensis TaxID=58242 RepID=A0A2M3ZTY6_9DIPT